MDDSVRAAMAKWPDVPALHGWLSLDESGHWRLKGEPITHYGLVAFINRNYDCDERGRWFFQNGPQRGYVELAYTPWVLYVDDSGALRDHTGEPVAAVSGAWLDDGGNILLETPRGIGLVDSDALPALVDWLVDADGLPAGADTLEPALAALQAGGDGGLYLRVPGADARPIGFVPRHDVPRRFGFEPDPRADDD